MQPCLTVLWSSSCSSWRESRYPSQRELASSWSSVKSSRLLFTSWASSWQRGAIDFVVARQGGKRCGLSPNVRNRKALYYLKGFRNVTVRPSCTGSHLTFVLFHQSGTTTSFPQADGLIGSFKFEINMRRAGYPNIFAGETTVVDPQTQINLHVGHFYPVRSYVSPTSCCIHYLQDARLMPVTYHRYGSTVLVVTKRAGALYKDGCQMCAWMPICRYAECRWVELSVKSFNVTRLHIQNGRAWCVYGYCFACCGQR